MQSILDPPRHAEAIGLAEPLARPIALDVRDPVLQIALEHLAGLAGYERVSNSGGGVPLVTDRVPRPLESADVLVCSATPLAARMAIGAMVVGVVGAIVSAEDPQRLVTALDMVSSGHALMPTTVVQAARHLPNLSARHHHELACVAAGMLHDSSIGDQLNVSAATAKRDVQQLLRMLHVTGRRQLADLARRLGYKTPLTDWEVSLLLAASVGTPAGTVTASVGQPEGGRAVPTVDARAALTAPTVEASVPPVRYLGVSDTRDRQPRRAALR